MPLPTHGGTAPRLRNDREPPPRHTPPGRPNTQTLPPEDTPRTAARGGAATLFWQARRRHCWRGGAPLLALWRDTAPPTPGPCGQCPWQHRALFPCGRPRPAQGLVRDPLHTAWSRCSAGSGLPRRAGRCVAATTDRWDGQAQRQQTRTRFQAPGEPAGAWPSRGPRRTRRAGEDTRVPGTAAPPPQEEQRAQHTPARQQRQALPRRPASRGTATRQDS